jgi:endoglucanase
VTQSVGRFALFLVIGLSTVSGSGQSQDRSAASQTAFTRAQHLKRGINVSHWFSQSPNDYSAHHTAAVTDDGDIALIARMGFDNVRLSIDATPLEQAPVDASGLNADFMARLDHALDTMLAQGLAVQVDLHPEDPFKMQLRTGDAAVDHFTALWRKLAAHYANRNPDLIFFEVMNEPEQNDPYRWAGIQARAAAAIREVAPRNTIIATGPNYSDIVDLLTQHPLGDGNVIYTFHFYDPHEFTHQGASWATSWWRYTHGIPYPAAEDSMQDLLKEVPDPANRYALELYWLDHWDAHRIQLLIDEAAAWAQNNRVPLICNEFGAFRQFTDATSRNAWIHDVRTALEADHIGWAMWDYRGNFGVVLKKDGEAAHADPATVEALGLKK